MSWKDNIKFPKAFFAGHYITRDEDGSIHVSPSRPYYIKKHFDENVRENMWNHRVNMFWIYDKFIDLSFLPKEFFTCPAEDAIVEVKHG